MGNSRNPLEAARAYLAGRSIRDLGIGVFLVALLVSGLFGGWQRATEHVPGLTLGEPVDTQPVTVTVHGVSTVHELDDHLLKTTEGRFIVVVADLLTENSRSIPKRDVVRSVRLRDVDGLFQRRAEDRPAHEIAPVILVAADQDELQDLGPGLTYRTLLVWEQRPGTPAPTEVTVEVYGQTYRKSSIDGTMRWFDPTIKARAVVPIAPSLEAVIP